MSLENPENQNVHFPLRHWFQKMSAEDQLMIDVDIFNDARRVDLQSVLDNVVDQEQARGIMGRLRRYLAWKKDGKTSPPELKQEAQDIAAYAKRMAFPEDHQQA